MADPSEMCLCCSSVSEHECLELVVSVKDLCTGKKYRLGVTRLVSWSSSRVGISGVKQRLATTSSGKTLARAGNLLRSGRRW